MFVCDVYNVLMYVKSLVCVLSPIELKGKIKIDIFAYNV